MKPRYERNEWLDHYLVFHYGNKEDQLPFDFGPYEALNFPVRCVSECVNLEKLPKKAKALDLGCAVGRSTFEFSRYCEHAVGIDNSESFISTAKHLQKHHQIDYHLHEEGSMSTKRMARLPEGVDPKRVEFICMDAMELPLENNLYDIVLAANLICRLHDPKLFLKRLHHSVAPSGQLIITTPYSWLEEFTPHSKWLKGKNGLESLSILNKHFQLKKAFDMPFLMREHLRKYQWGVAQASIWIKKT